MALAALLPGQAQAQDALVGVWDIQVHDGSAEGDHGHIVIRRTADGLVGDMEFTDVSEDVDATESCEVRPGHLTIRITCTVQAVRPLLYAPSYVPDNLVVRLVSPDRIDGHMLSATTGRATLTRGETPLS